MAEIALRAMETELRRLSGATAARIADRPHSRVAEHRHDWPILSVIVMGEHRKVHERGDVLIDGPAAVIHGAGAPHANIVGAAGSEQLDIAFDPDWLDWKVTSLFPGQVLCWTRGPVVSAARALACVWSRGDQNEEQLQATTARSIRLALAAEPFRPPAWLDEVRAAIDPENAPSARDLAARVGLHPSWLAQAYRAATGEGLRETLQRRRVERALALLTRSDARHADIAAAAGFCDQSHMIRTFRRLLGRTPSQMIEGCDGQAA